MEQIKALLRELENEISSEKFITLYQRIRKTHPLIKSYLTPQELISYLHNQSNPDYALNDKILLSLIREYHKDMESNAVGPYLFIVFKPGLLKLFSQFRQRAKCFSSFDDVDLWFQIVALFFEELRHIALSKDDTKIASKIIGRIKNKLRDYFKELFRVLQAESALKENPSDTYTLPLETSPDELDTSLSCLVATGIISETDKYILLGSKVYGKSMKELSQGLKGISYANIRQRKLRAQKAIRAYYKEKNF